MQQHHNANINDSYHFKRSSPSGDLVFVFNSDNYVMAEYHMRSAHTAWHRVVPVTQRESVEKWLGQHYPVPRGPEAVAVVELKARAARQ